MIRTFLSPSNEKNGSAAAYELLERAFYEIFGEKAPVIAKTVTGKPFFPARPDVYFSVSHTEGYVLCAVADRPIGADIQKLREVRDGLAERVCTASELEAFDFFDLWTLKESYIKLWGDNAVSAHDLRFKKDGDGLCAPLPSVRAVLYRNMPEHRAAICALREAPPDAPEFIGLR